MARAFRLSHTRSLTCFILPTRPMSLFMTLLMVRTRCRSALFTCTHMEFEPQPAAGWFLTSCWEGTPDVLTLSTSPCCRHEGQCRHEGALTC